VTLEMMLLLIITMEMELINRTAALLILEEPAARTNFINTDSRLVWGEVECNISTLLMPQVRQVLNQTQMGIGTL
jgi:hypothetical protein